MMSSTFIESQNHIGINQFSDLTRRAMSIAILGKLTRGAITGRTPFTVLALEMEIPANYGEGMILLLLNVIGLSHQN